DFATPNEILSVEDNASGVVPAVDGSGLVSVQGAKEVELELNLHMKRFYMAGWRIGFGFSRVEYDTAIVKVESNMASGMFDGLQKGAIKALELSKDWYAELNEVYTRRRALIFQLADKLGCTYDINASGMFVWAKLPEGIHSAEEFIDGVLYDKSIFITPGTIFGSQGEGYIRFSLCVKEEQIQQAIQRFEV